MVLITSRKMVYQFLYKPETRPEPWLCLGVMRSSDPNLHCSDKASIKNSKPHATVSLSLVDDPNCVLQRNTHKTQKPTNQLIYAFNQQINSGSWRLSSFFIFRRHPEIISTECLCRMKWKRQGRSGQS